MKLELSADDPQKFSKFKDVFSVKEKFCRKFHSQVELLTEMSKEAGRKPDEKRLHNLEQSRQG